MISETSRLRIATFPASQAGISFITPPVVCNKIVQYLSDSMFRPKNHDLSLPDWGPYFKRYAGVSHVANHQLGMRFDCSIFPALYRRRTDVPNARWESPWHPWDCAPNFEHFSFRHELTWKDRLYADIAYTALPEANGILIRCEFVNATERPVPVALHTAAAMQFPSALGQKSSPRIHPQLKKGALVIHPLDYEDLHFASPTPGDTLNADGLLRGEIRVGKTLDGSALGGRFGRTHGDRVQYRFHLEAPITNGVLVVRLQGQGAFNLSGAVTASCTFAHQDAQSHRIAVGHLGSGEHRLEIQVSAEDFTLFALVFHEKNTGEFEFTEADSVPRPEIQLPDESEQAGCLGPEVILKYSEEVPSYGITWDTPNYEIREILHDELDSFLRQQTHNHVDRVLHGNGRGHFTNIHLRPLALAANSKTVLWGLVCAGARAHVKRALARFAEGTPADREQRRANSHAAAAEKAFSFAANPAGEHFAFSQNRMAATTLSNIVFPVYIQRQHIRHRPPGRWWDSLYTWDSGFIGLGLLEISATQAWENLDQYLTDPGNPHGAFIHHGSMVPMQVHLYHELWNRTQDLTRLKAHYASMRACYRFHAGHAEGSTTRNLHSGLLRPWDYFYNSGGWDDYPPQAHVHRHGLQKNVTPVISSAQAIRCAKSLLLAAETLGETADIAAYESDIAAFTKALEDHSWDESSGCYSYVVHDEAGYPSHPLRHKSGLNYNLGLDGLYPLMAGICSPERAKQFENWIFDPDRLWTSSGITAVDQTAPYFRADGYWSGTVWFPHQWFLWKTMLDLGNSKAAFQIASRALETWRAEVDESYDCFEHFHSQTGRGCGWHQFSGLSTPVMIFFASCYCPGKLSVGFDAWVVRSQFAEDHRAFTGEISFPSNPRFPAVRRAVWVCLQSGQRYRAMWDSAEISFTELLPGLLAFELPVPIGDGSATLQIGTQDFPTGQID